MEPFNRTCQSQSVFKFRTPILVSNVIYEVNSDEESLQLDLDKIVPCECTSKCQPKINILSVLEISNNNFRCNEPEKKCNVSAKKEHKSSSVSEANHIKCNSKNTQNKIQNNTSQSLRDCEDKNKRPSKKENLTSPKKLKVIPKSNVTDEGNILNTKSFEGKVQKLQFVTESNPSPVSSKQLETSKGTSDVNYLKAKKQKVSQGKELKAFVNLLSSVYESSDLRNLLSKDEHQALNTFLRLNNKHQYSILKLLIWKKNWYNIFKFCEEANIEIQDSKDVIDIFQSLDSSGFVDINYHKKYDNIPSLLESLSKNNIVNIMTALKMKSCKSKSENICKIIALIERQQTDRYKKIVMSLIQEHMGLCVKLSIEKARALHNVYTLATFTNSMFRNIRDSLNCEIMCPCSTIEHFLIFSRRIQFENYAEALQIYNQLDAIKSKTNKIGILDIGRNVYEKLINLEEEEPEKTTPHLYKFRAEYIYIKILTECCRNISTKKTGFPEDVMTWLEFLITKFPEHKGLGEWYYKLIWLYMNHIEPVNYEKASVIMIQALTKCKGDEISLYKLANLAKIIKKSKKHKLKQFYHDKITYKMPRLIKETDIPTDHINLLKSSNIKKGNKKMFVVKELLNGEINLRNMTQLAILYYEQDGYQGIPCENSLIHALFMSFFWDIIYSPPRNVPAIFISSIQIEPLDIFTKYFYENRKVSFENRLHEIESKWTTVKAVDFAMNIYQEHSHEWSVCGPINKIVPEEKIVSDVIAVIGPTLLSKIFRKVMPEFSEDKDLQRFSRGIPNLFLYNIEEEKCKFVEVTDGKHKLATNQLLWLKYLQNNRANVAIACINSGKELMKN